MKSADPFQTEYLTTLSNMKEMYDSIGEKVRSARQISALTRWFSVLGSLLLALINVSSLVVIIWHLADPNISDQAKLTWQVVLPSMSVFITFVILYVNSTRANSDFERQITEYVTVREMLMHAHNEYSAKIRREERLSKSSGQVTDELVEYCIKLSKIKETLFIRAQVVESGRSPVYSRLDP